jgi:alpha-1,2-mannosyltransferase
VRPPAPRITSVPAPPTTPAPGPAFRSTAIFRNRHSQRATSWPYVIAVVAAITLIAYLSAWGSHDGLDLKVYRDSASSWMSAKNPYLMTFTRSGLSFTYPPFALLVLSPLTWASFPITQWLLWAASLAAATGSIVLVLHDMGATVTQRLWCKAFTWSCVSAIALEPARSAVDYGQIEFILMFIVVADLLVPPSRYRGIGIGLAAAVKLTPLSFIIFLIVSRDTKSVIRAAVSFLVCTGLPWLLWPRLSRVFWFHDVSDPGRVGTVTYGGNQSWYAILHRPPFPANGSGFAWLLLSLITLTVSAFVAWRCVSARQKAAAVVAIALAGLLVSPISWTHHWVWAVLIPALMVRYRSPDVRKPVRVMLWGIIALTTAAPYWWFSYGIPADITEAVLPLWTSAVLLVWSMTAFETWRNPAPSSVPAPSSAPAASSGNHPC